MTIHRSLLFLSLAFLLPAAAPSARPAVLTVGAASFYDLAPYFTFVKDPGGRLTADDLVRPSPALRFQRPEGPEVNFGYSHAAYWLKAVLRTHGNRSEPYLLEISYPTLDHVRVVLVGPHGARQTSEAGDLQPFAQRPYRHHNLVFPLSIPPGGDAVLLIRVRSEGSLTVPATLWRESAFYRHSLDEYAILSLYFGILAALFLYNLLLYWSLRDGVYLAYVCFVASMAVGQLSQCGLGNEYLWPAYTAWGNIAYPSGFAATGFFGALFTRLFLDTRRSAPRLDRAITALAAGFAFAAVSPAFLPYQTTAILTSLCGISFSIVAVAAGVVCYVQGNPGARWFLLAWTLLLLGVGMLGLRNFAWLPTTFVTSYGMQIGSALEMLLLSFALADRITQVRREKDAAQQTALRLAAEKEQESENKAREWEETFNSISDMVIILDRDYRIIKANRAAALFLGAAPEGLVGRTCYSLHHRDGCRPDACPCAMTFGSGTAGTREFFEPKFGKFLEVSTSPILDRTGAVIAAVHITKDVTWRKNMEEELLRTQKLDSLAVLAGGIAHDFNNMLTVIMSTVTLAKIYAGGDSRVTAKIEEAEEEIIHARDLTGQLLTFAKGGAPVKRLSSLPDLVRDTVAFSLKGSNVASAFTIAPDLWAAEIDRTQISQVVSNLTINAIQAMPNGGQLRVSADNADLNEGDDVPLPPGRYVRLVFADAGTGIAAENLPRIFDPFFTTKEGGSGLGLATSYSIVKKHGGSIDVLSQPGAGARFTIYLPASIETAREAPQPAGASRAGSGRVLLMDDDEKLAKNVGEMLETLGYEVELARNGEEAIILYKRALALARPFAAVVLDMTVAGGMGGKDCIAALRELDPGVAAIVVSGYSEDAVLADYAAFGFRDALSKPFTVEDLQEKLSALTGRREGRA